MSMDPAAISPQPRRQARGERRIDQLLEAAAQVFADVGYEKASTNAIAATAGVSPGTLYQFFANKEAIAQALAERYAVELDAAHDEAFGLDGADLPTEALVDRITDTLIGFNLKHPAFKTVFAGPEAPPALACVVAPLHDRVVGRVERLIEARRPELAAEDRRRYAVVSTQIFKSLAPLVLQAPARQRPTMIAELKRAMAAYLRTFDRT